MAVVFRAVWNDDRSEICEELRARFVHWVEVDKGLPLVVPGVGTAEAEGFSVSVLDAEHDACCAVRFTLAEEQPGQHWKTILTAMTREDERVVWVDQEWVAEDVFSRPPDVASTRVVRDLLAGGHGQSGATVLGAESHSVVGRDVDDLVAAMVDPARDVPLIVFSPRHGDPPAVTRARAAHAASVLAGTADVWALDETSVSALSEAIGPDLHVYGGAVRTYLPGIDLEDPQGWRHRYIRRDRIERHPRDAARLLARHVFLRAAARRPPQLYRDVVRFMPGFPAGTDEETWGLIADLEAERDQARERLANLEEDLLLAAMEQQEALEDLSRANERIRYLENRLAESGDPQYGLSTPPPAIPLEANSCREAVSLAKSHLHGLAFGGNADAGVDFLDGFDKTAVWGNKAWMAFRALHAYVQGKRSGEITSDFLTACQSGQLGTHAIPRGWITMHESETTDQNPAFRAARTFPVDRRVSESGELYMPAHVKLQPGGSPAPRVHFHDDTMGITGQVHIGWFGDHLPNKSTN